jgi:hypothetical protein
LTVENLYVMGDADLGIESIEQSVEVLNRMVRVTRDNRFEEHHLARTEQSQCGLADLSRVSVLARDDSEIVESSFERKE